MKDLKALIREIPDHPKPGILFYDITTLLADPDGLRTTVDRFIDLLSDLPVDKVVGMESRGFLFAPILAYELGAGFVPVRKPGKLPGATLEHEYDLEYGSDRLEIHIDGVNDGEQVLIVDDLIATGGTAAATARLVESAGGNIAGFGFVIELNELRGRERLEPHPVRSLIHY